MKAYILNSGLRISPFDDAPGEAFVLNRPSEERRDEILKRLGLEPVRIERMEEIKADEFLLLLDYVYVSRACLKRFLKAVSKHRQSRRLALEANPQIEMALPMQDLCPYPPAQEEGPPVYGFDLYYFHGDGFEPQSLNDLLPEIVPIKQYVVDVDPPFYVRLEDKIRIGISKSYCMHVKHWTHIYLLNFAALVGLPLEWFPRKLLWALWRILTAFSLNRFKLLKRLVIKGKKCTIHPTATVEASILGNNVSIGANAVIRGAYIGDNVRISEGGKVFGSVVGDGSEVTWNSILNMSLLYPRSCVGIPGLQTVMVGKDTFVSSMAFVIDVKFQGGYIGVRHKGKTVTTRFTTLGPCFGHRVRIGAGAVINCGREIPNDVAVIPDAGPVLSRVPDGIPGGIYTIKESRLVPVHLGGKEPTAQGEPSAPPSGQES